MVIYSPREKTGTSRLNVITSRAINDTSRRANVCWVHITMNFCSFSLCPRIPSRLWILRKQLAMAYPSLISRRWKKDREKQWKAIYLTNTCLSAHWQNRESVFWGSYVIRIVWLSLELLKKNRAIRLLCVIVILLVDLMNDQVSSLQRNGIAANSVASAV